MSLPWKTSVALAAIAGLVFAGCASVTPDGASGSGTLTRHVTFSFSETSNFSYSGTPEEQVAHFAKTSFDYKQGSGTLDVAGVNVHFQTVGGLDSKVALSTLTSKTQIASGETVALAPSGMSWLSSMTLEQAGTTLASRTGADRSWFTVEGAPIPIASTQSGSAAWSLHADGKLGAHLKGLEFTSKGPTQCDGSGCTQPMVTNTIDKVDLDYTNTLDGTFEERTTMQESGTKVAVSLPSLKDRMDVTAGFKGTIGGQSLDVGLTGGITATLAAAGDLTFDAAREVSAAGGQGSVNVDGGFSFTGLPAGANDNNPLSNIHYSNSVPYTSQAIHLGGHGDATLSAFLKRLWAVDLAVGDQFNFQFKSSFADMTYVSQVLGGDAKMVGSVLRPTLRLSDHFSTDIHIGTTPRTFAFDFTYWVDSQSYLPIYEQGSITQTVRASDFPELRTLFESLVASDGGSVHSYPDDASLTITTQATLQMTSYSGDYTHAGILASAASPVAPVAIVGAAVAFVLVNNLGKSSGPSTPNLSFMTDDSADRLTIVSADSQANWDRITVSAIWCSGEPSSATINVGGSSSPHANRAATMSSSAVIAADDCSDSPLPVAYSSVPVRAGDFLSFCADGATASNVQVSIEDMASNTMLGTFSFPTIAQCA